MRNHALLTRIYEDKIVVDKAQKDLIDKIAVTFQNLPEVSKEKYLQYLLYSQRPDGSFPEPPIIFSGIMAKEEINHEVAKTEKRLMWSKKLNYLLF